MGNNNALCDGGLQSHCYKEEGVEGVRFINAKRGGGQPDTLLPRICTVVVPRFLHREPGWLKAWHDFLPFSRHMTISILTCCA